MSRLQNASTQLVLVIEPDGLVRSTVAAVVRELDLAQVHQAASVQTGAQVLTNTAVDVLVLSLADNDAALDLLISLREGKCSSDSSIPVVVIASACDSALALRLKELDVFRLLLRPFRIRDVVQTLQALMADSSPELGVI